MDRDLLHLRQLPLVLRRGHQKSRAIGMIPPLAHPDSGCETGNHRASVGKAALRLRAEATEGFSHTLGHPYDMGDSESGLGSVSASVSKGNPFDLTSPQSPAVADDLELLF